VRSTPLADSDSPVALSVPARKQSPKTRERRRDIIISCGILFAVALALLQVVATEFPISSHLTDSSQTANEAPDNHLGSAKVMIDSADGNGCRQQVLDNQTWRMTRSHEPCDTTARDSNGFLRPEGTIHRLDAISKSFLGK
jgi:hypothetical protein